MANQKLKLNFFSFFFNANPHKRSAWWAAFRNPESFWFSCLCGSTSDCQVLDDSESSPTHLLWFSSPCLSEKRTHARVLYFRPGRLFVCLLVWSYSGLQTNKQTEWMRKQLKCTLAAVVECSFPCSQIVVGCVHKSIQTCHSPTQWKLALPDSRSGN